MYFESNVYVKILIGELVEQFLEPLTPSVLFHVNTHSDEPSRPQCLTELCSAGAGCE